MSYSISTTDFEKNSFEAARHKDVVCQLHIHYRMELVCVKSGEVVMQVGDDIRKIGAGEGTFILPFEAHSFETPVSSECFVIVFSPELVPDVHSLMKGMIAEKGNAVCKLRKEIFLLCDEKLQIGNNVTDDINARAILYPIISEVISKCTFIPGGRNHEGSVFIGAVCYICENFRTEDISLSSVASVLNVHKVYLSRTFKESAGISYTKYVNSVRSSYAARLLADKKGKNISDVAFDAGFGSIRNFNREFKAFYGVSPENFIKTFENGDD